MLSNCSLTVLWSLSKCSDTWTDTQSDSLSSCRSQKQTTKWTSKFTRGSCWSLLCPPHNSDHKVWRRDSWEYCQPWRSAEDLLTKRLFTESIAKYEYFFYSNLMSRWWQRDCSLMASDEVVTNRDPGVFTKKSCHKSRLQPWPIRGKNLGHMICSDHSEVGIWVTWPIIEKERAAYRL